MRNPLCPPEVLAEAQSHEVADVRASVAMHPRATPTEVLDVLASDPETDTRCLVASHPNSRLRTLDFMLEDARAKGRKMASNCLEAARMAEGAIPIEVLVAANLKLRREVALRTHQTDTVQASLARDADAGVRILLASSRGVGVASLDVLATDEDPAVRHAVAQSERTPKPLLEQLAKDRCRWVSQAAWTSLQATTSNSHGRPQKRRPEGINVG